MNPIVKLAASFSPPAIDRMTLEVYIERLSKEKPEHVAWAVDQSIDRCRHFPRVSELLEFIKQRKSQLADAALREEQRRLISETVNRNPPKLLDLLNRQRERGGEPRRLL